MNKIIKYPMARTSYYNVPTTKNNIVLHAEGRTCNTGFGHMGRASTTIDQWDRQPDKSGAPYLVDRDGTIYITFDHTLWIKHLGLGRKEGFHDKESIAICLANELQLTGDGDKLYAFDRVHPQNLYTGQTYLMDGAVWADLSADQVGALATLLMYACEYSKLPATMLRSADYDEHCWGKATIIRHRNCKKDAVDLPLQDWVFDILQEEGISLI